MATSVAVVVAVVFADTLAGRFVAVPAEVDRAVRLFGDALAGAVFFVGAVRAAAARLGRAVVAFACGFADLAGAVVAFFFGDLAALVLAAGPVAFAVLRAVPDDFAAVLAAGVRDDVADALVVARFVGRAAFAADVLVAVAVFAARGVPDRDARPPRPTAAIATPSWSELDGRCLRSRGRSLTPQRRPRIRARRPLCHWARRGPVAGPWPPWAW
jgi:hypothetical protein